MLISIVRESHNSLSTTERKGLSNDITLSFLFSFLKNRKILF